jgi:hypothetical protein
MLLDATGGEAPHTERKRHAHSTADAATEAEASGAGVRKAASKPKKPKKQQTQAAPERDTAASQKKRKGNRSADNDAAARAPQAMEPADADADAAVEAMLLDIDLVMADLPAKPPVTAAEREAAEKQAAAHTARQQVEARQRSGEKLQNAADGLYRLVDFARGGNRAMITPAALRIVEPALAAVLSDAAGVATTKFLTTHGIMSAVAEWAPEMLAVGLDAMVADALLAAINADLKATRPQGEMRTSARDASVLETVSKSCISGKFSDASWLQNQQRMLKDAAQTLTIEEAMALFTARQKATMADAPPPVGTPDSRCAEEQAALGAARGGAAARGATSGGRTAAAGSGGAAAAAAGGDSVAEAAKGGAGGAGGGGLRGPFGAAQLWAGALLPAPENAFKRATKLYKYIPHRLKQQDFEDSDIQLMMSGSGVALKRKDTNKMVYLTAFQFDEAARVAEATDYAHCAAEHAEHVQLLKGIWDLYDSKYLQDYDAAVRDAVTRMPGSVGFMSNHTHLWKQHVEMPHMRNMISRSGADSNHMPATRYRAQGRDGPPRAAPVYGGGGGTFNVNGGGGGFNVNGRGAPRQPTLQERIAEHEEYAAKNQPPEKHWALCRDFAGGGCKNPANCWYAHYCGDPACGWGVGRYKCGGNHPPAAPRNGSGGGRGGGRGGAGYSGRGGSRGGRGRA